MDVVVAAEKDGGVAHLRIGDVRTIYVNATGIWWEMRYRAILEAACNIVLIDGEEMQNKLGGYLGELFNQNPASVGGKLPEADFYYVK